MMRMRARQCASIFSLLTVLIIIFLATNSRRHKNNSFKSNDSIDKDAEYNASQLTIGTSESQQLMFYLAHADIIDSLPPTRQGHKVTLVSVIIRHTLTATLAVFKLRDDVQHHARGHSEQRMHGGNSYRTIYRGRTHRQACAYVDNSDDTYEVICRVWESAGACAEVSVHVTYVAWGAYRWHGVYTNELIWRGPVCVTSRSNRAADVTGSGKGVAGVSEYVGWYRGDTNEAWRWVGYSMKELMTDEEMRSCLASLPAPVEFVGDSQLRYAFISIIRTVDDSARNFSLGKLRTNHTRDKYMYSFASFTVNFEALPGFLNDERGLLPRYKVFKDGAWKMTCNDVTVEGALARWKLRELQKPSPSPVSNRLALINQRRRLILSFGTWDTDRINIKYFVSRSIPALRQFLESLQRDGILSKVKVIVTTIAAVKEQTYNDASHPGLHSHLRNNAMLAAVNHLLAETVHAFDDVSLVDWFAMTVSRPLKAADGTHYLNADGSVNDVGISMARLLVENACS